MNECCSELPIALTFEEWVEVLSRSIGKCECDINGRRVDGQSNVISPTKPFCIEDTFKWDDAFKQNLKLYRRCYTDEY